MAKLLVSLVALSAPCALISQTLEAYAASPNNLPPDARSIRTRFTYKASVTQVPNGTKTLRVWLPVPTDNQFQKVSSLQIESAVPHRITTEKRYGNRMLFLESAGAGKVDVSVSFIVERKEIAPLANGYKAPDGDPAKFREADRLVPIGGRYEEIADSVVGSLSRPVDKLRAIYEHTVANMQYDYNKESPKLGQGDVAFVCDYKKGNCSDLHSYMISLARSEGVPAYLEYGFPLSGIPVPAEVPTKGTIGGYHCWMWFHDPELGWLPLDASDGRRWLDIKRTDVKDRLFGNLVLERSAVALSRGRDLVLEPAQKAPPLNSFIYPYAEADGEPVEAKWVMEYELLTRAGALINPSGTVQDQMNELRQIVLAQAKELAALKAAPVNSAAGQVTNAASKQSVKVYGFVRTDAIFDSHATNPNSQFPFFVESPDKPGIGRDSERFTLHPRLTRLGLDFAETRRRCRAGSWAARSRLTTRAEAAKPARRRARGIFSPPSAEAGSNGFLARRGT
jgi:transglutaminase-like putative cysteine protease